MTVIIGRRELLAALGGAAVAWPITARAQQSKMLRVGYSGILPRGAPHYAAFERRMAELGYQPGRNFTFENIQAPSIEGYELTYRELAARCGHDPAVLLRSYAKRTRKADTSAAAVIGALAKNVLR